MDERAIQVLLVEDSATEARLIQAMLADSTPSRFDLEWVDHLSAGLERLADGGIDVVLLDLTLPDSRGLDTFTKMHARSPHVPILVLTGLDDEDLAVQSMRAGAQDYLPKKDVDGPLLARTIRHAIERKRAEEELRALSSRQEAILAAVPDIIMEVDAGRVYTWANAAGFEFFGPDVLGREAAYYFEGEQDTYNMVQPLFNGDESTFYVESWQRRQDGETRLLGWWCRALKDQGGKVRGALSTARDITERTRAEEALRRRAAQLTLLNDIGSRITSMLDLDGLLDRVTRLVQEEFGYHHVALFTVERDLGELVMRSLAGDFVDLFSPDHRLKLEQGIVGWVARYGETLLVNDVEADPRYVNLYPGLVPTRAELSVPILVRQEIVGVLDVQSPQVDAFDENDVLVMEILAGQVAVAIQNARLYQDLQNQMDELTHTQAQLVQSAKMMAIGELAAGVAHELNNPLTAVLGFSELLLQTADPDDTTREDLSDIAIQARRARDIVRNLLSFARQTKFHRRRADVNQVIQDVLALSRRRLEHSRIAVEERYAADLPPILLDLERMKQVILNLITNALHAMPQGGTLTLRSERVGDEVAVHVADTGVGIPKENLTRIFQPFFTTRPVGQGTGLGLSISLGIVQEHGGRIQVESQPGEGSTFTIFLPIEGQPGEQPRSPGPASGTPLRGSR